MLQFWTPLPLDHVISWQRIGAGRESSLDEPAPLTRRWSRLRYHRQMGPVTFRKITAANRAAVEAIRVAPEQVRFVGTVAGALQDAEEAPEGKPWYRAIYVDTRPVGFVMVSWNVDPDPPRIIGPWFLWKLLIGQEHQLKGYGRAAVGRVADLISLEGATELLTSYVEGDGGPAGFYAQLGFRPTGDRDDQDEIVASLDLSR